MKVHLYYNWSELDKAHQYGVVVTSRHTTPAYNFRPSNMIIGQWGGFDPQLVNGTMVNWLWYYLGKHLVMDHAVNFRLYPYSPSNSQHIKSFTLNCAQKTGTRLADFMNRHYVRMVK